MTQAVQGQVHKVLDTYPGRRTLSILDDLISIMDDIYKKLEKSSRGDEDEGVDIEDSGDVEVKIYFGGLSFTSMWLILSHHLLSGKY